jgi:hypothetical protein
MEREDAEVMEMGRETDIVRHLNMASLSHFLLYALVEV